MSPHDVIEQIRRGEYMIGMALPPDAARAIEGMKRRFGNALKLLSDDLYSNGTHFILELIQNADDNKYPDNVIPSVTFDIRTSQLEIRNNEYGFTAENVRALCSVGDSTKVKEKRLGFIGEKGIGFKSVFTASDAPEIHSNGFHFRFDRRDQSDPLGYVIPHWINHTKHQDSIGTSIVLPAKETKTFNASIVKGIEVELLLFMRRLRLLEIAVEESSGRSIFTRRDVGNLLILSERDGKSLRVRRRRYLVTRRADALRGNLCGGDVGLRNEDRQDQRLLPRLFRASKRYRAAACLCGLSGRLVV